MPRLKGVEVLDMEDGEVMKIAYEGKKYTKTNEEARPGDIILNHKESTFGCRLKNSYYKVTVVDDYARVSDENGEDHGWAHRAQGSHFDVFRKGIEPGMYAKAVVADIDITDGKYYLIEEVDEVGDGIITDDVGDPRFVMQGTKRFELVDEKPIEFQEGDYAKVVGMSTTERKLGQHGFELGEIVKISRTHDKGAQCLKANGETVFGPHVAYEDLEPASEPGNTFNEGDYAKILGSEHSSSSNVGEHGFNTGEIVRIVKDYDFPDKHAKCERVSGEFEMRPFVAYKDLGSVDGAEINEAMAATFEVGDIVEIGENLDEVIGVQEPEYFCHKEGVTLRKSGWAVASKLTKVASAKDRMDK